MGAALKNVIAVGAGALHGLGYGGQCKSCVNDKRSYQKLVD